MNSSPQAQQESSTREVLAGLVERVTFHNAENGFCVLRIKIRVRAGISYALTEAMDEGHCGLPTEELVPFTVELLQVPAELIQTTLDLELAERTVVADTVGETACIFLAGLYRAEEVIAERILRLVNGTRPWPHIDPPAR